MVPMRLMMLRSMMLRAAAAWQYAALCPAPV